MGLRERGNKLAFRANEAYGRLCERGQMAATYLAIVGTGDYPGSADRAVAS